MLLDNKGCGFCAFGSCQEQILGGVWSSHGIISQGMILPPVISMVHLEFSHEVPLPDDFCIDYRWWLITWADFLFNRKWATMPFSNKSPSLIPVFEG